MSEQHFDQDHTHVYLVHPGVDGGWWCPTTVAETYVEQRDWVYAAPPDLSLKGLFDESTASGDQQTGFDPGEHTVDEVNAHLDEMAHAPGEVARVLALEEAGQQRVGVLDGPHAPGDDPDPELDDPNPHGDN